MAFHPRTCIQNHGFTNGENRLPTSCYAIILRLAVNLWGEQFPPFFVSGTSWLCKMFSQLIVRRLATTASGKPLGVVPANARYQKLQQLQNAFCRDDGLLVWQKMGGRDKLMYYTTLLITVGGLIPCLTIIGKMSFPKKQE